MAKFKSKEGLQIDFNPIAKLEVETRKDSWCETSFYMFRSWSGNRRINGTPFNGNVYFLGSNVISETVRQTQTA